MKQLGQYAAPRHAIAHLSDPHLIGGGGLHHGVIDNVANLHRALDRHDGFQDRVHEVDGLRIVALDTSVPGYHHGALRPEQLAWLADVPATPVEHGTLVALHHPPLPLPMLRAAELIELHDRFVSGADAGQAFTMVHTYDDLLVHTLVPLERGTEVSHVGSDIAEALETVPLEQARELASSKTSQFND